MKLCSYCLPFKNNTRVKKRFEGFYFFSHSMQEFTTVNFNGSPTCTKGRIDPLFQKNDQDKGEFWFHFVKFKGKLNSGREKERER